MTIAGSDSGGGAGIEADLRVFAAHNVHGTVAITAVTAQNTLSVSAVCALEPEMVRAQVEAVTSDFSVAAVKTGMLARPRTVEEVGRLAQAGTLPHLVIDPVLVSSTGYPLMEVGGTEAYREALIPYATVVSPNLRETALLLGGDVREFEDMKAMRDAGVALRALGATWVVIKGGHFLADGVTASNAPDVIAGPDGVIEIDGERITTRNDHGTGCSLSSAIAANLANGLSSLSAIAQAKEFVANAIASAAAWELGGGHGPIDHFGWGATDPTIPLP